jgi:hypothetical protein
MLKKLTVVVVYVTLNTGRWTTDEVKSFVRWTRRLELTG